MEPRQQFKQAQEIQRQHQFISPAPQFHHQQQFDQDPQMHSQQPINQKHQPHQAGGLVQRGQFLQSHPDVLEEPVLPPTSPVQLPFYPALAGSGGNERHQHFSATNANRRPQPIFPDLPSQPAKQPFLPREAQVGSISFRSQAKAFEAVPAVPIFPDLPDLEQGAGLPYSRPAQAEVVHSQVGKILTQLCFSLNEE